MADDPHKYRSMRPVDFFPDDEGDSHQESDPLAHEELDPPTLGDLTDGTQIELPPVDAELSAIQVVAVAMETLDLPARKRVLDWATKRYLGR